MIWAVQACFLLVAASNVWCSWISKTLAFEKWKDEQCWQLSRTVWAHSSPLYPNSRTIWWLQGQCGRVSPTAQPWNTLAFWGSVTTTCFYPLTSPVFSSSSRAPATWSFISVPLPVLFSLPTVPSWPLVCLSDIYFLSNLSLKYHILIEICLFFIPVLLHSCH